MSTAQLRDPRRSTASLSLESVLIASLLAVAAFLIEAGAAEVVLARHTACVAASRSMRLGQLSPPGCLSAEELATVTAIGRGPVGVFGPDLTPAVAWLAGIPVHGLLGALSRLFGGRWWPVVLLGLQAILTAVLAAVGFLRMFIA
ncbi:MAG: hypothetical protein WD906_05860 [Anaerolineales bacterium]